MRKLMLVIILSLMAQMLFAVENALSFDGSNDYVNISSAITAPTTTQAVTIEAWVYPATNSGTRIMASKYFSGSSSSSNFNITRTPEQKILISGNGTNAMTSNGIVPLNIWTHIAVVFNSGTNNTKIYISGVLDTSGTLNYNTNNTSTDMRIGEFSNFTGQSYYTRWAGKIDEFRLWNSVRSQAEISGNMNNALTGTETGLVAYYGFNHGVANGTNTGITTLSDLTGHGWNGTLYSFALSGTTSNWVEGVMTLGVPVIGDGTSGNPYQIATLSNLYWITTDTDNLNKFYIQTADIDASSTSSWFGGQGWPKIGDVTTPFTGTYDGQSYKITGLFINRTGTYHIGLFGYTNAATIKNVLLEGVLIQGYTSSGSLVGYNNASVIENCYSTGTVTGANNVGGLIGYNSSGSVISFCSSSCTVSGASNIGGLAGYNTSSTIGNSYSRGNVSCTTDYAGGLCGRNNVSAAINNSYSTGSVSGTGAKGGLTAANLSSSVVNNSFWDINTSGQTASDGGTGKTSAEMKTLSTFISAGWDFIGETANGTNDYWKINGTGNSGYPYLSWQNIDPPEVPTAISASNTSQTGFTANWNSASGASGYLLDVAKDSNFTNYVAGYNNLNVGNVVFKGLSGQSSGTVYYYRVRAYNAWGTSSSSNVVAVCTNPSASAPSAGNGTKDYPYRISTLSNLYWIASNTANWNKCYVQISEIDAAATEYWFEGQGWLKIGDAETPFTGTYDGQRNKITGLHLNRTGTYHNGMFGYTHGAMIKNVILENAEVHGYITTGSLVGYNNASVVENCSSTGTVTGTNNIGGLIGYNSGGSVISVCSSSCTVSGASNIGGLAGYNTSSTIEFSYARGSANCTVNYAGGLCGRNNVSATINNSYSTGTVTGTGALGGLTAGNLSSSVVNNSFWDINTSGQITSEGGTGRTTAEMKTIVTFINAGWDFDDETANGINDYWEINETDNNGYPYLFWQFSSQTDNALSFDGTNDHVNISSSITAPTTTQPVTFEAWVYPTTNFGTQVISSKYYSGSSSSSNFNITRNPDQKLLISGNGTNSLTSNGILPPGKWTHIAVVFNAGTNNTKIYISGVLDNSGTLNYNSYNSFANMRIGELYNHGSQTYYSRWSGAIDELRLWNKVLTEQEISSNMNSSLLGNESGLVAYYGFNQGFTNGVNPGVTTLSDLTGNGWNGSLSFFALTGTISNWVEGVFDVDPPAVPEAVAASNITVNGFTANWNAASLVYGYYLDVDDNNDFSTPLTGYNNLNVGNVLFKAVTGLTAGITYYYRVRAYNPGGTSGSSNTIEIYIPVPEAPSIPVALDATNITVNSFTSNWTASERAEGYFLDVAFDSTFTNFAAGYQNKYVMNVTSFNTVNIKMGTTYYFRVRAYNQGGTSADSNFKKLQTVYQLYTDINAGLPGLRYGSGEWGDYDNDGDLDLILSGASGALMTDIYRNSNNVFTGINAGLLSLDHGSVSWGDKDNDGDLDLLVCGVNSVPYTRVYTNSGGTSFGSYSLTGVKQGMAKWGDYDNDGDPDILITGNDSGGNALTKIFRNDGSHFADINAGIIDLGYSSCDWGDYDNDGDPDILITGYTGTNRISRIYRNDAGVFTDIVAGFTGIHYGVCKWVDYDNDGYLDVFLSGQSSSGNTTKLYRNNGVTFTAVTTGLPGVQKGSAAWGDLDNDGYPDLVISGDTGSGYISRVYRNNNGVFTDMSAGFPGVINSFVSLGDYDNDNDLDILLTGDTGSELISKIYRNNNITDNSRPNSPDNLQVSFNGSKTTLSWNVSTDDITPSQALSYNVYIGSGAGTVNFCSPMSRTADGFRKVARIGNAGNMESYTINNLPDGVYYWSVQAVDNAYTGSEFAAEGTFVVGFGAPQNLTITSTSSSAELSWIASSGASSYKIYSAENPYAEFPAGWTIETSISGTNWTDMAATGAKKFYVVVAVSGKEEEVKDVKIR
jgi:hypothetical protein